MAGAGAGVVTLLFTDLVGSTELLSALGDDRAEDLRRMHFRLLRQAVADAGGREVRNRGAGLIRASELVRGLAERRCEIQFRPLGPLTLKGLGQPVPACEVLWQRDDEPPALPPAFAAITSGPRLVGRRPELGRLREAWEHARDGSRQLVLLAGEPGIGKTRL